MPEIGKKKIVGLKKLSRKDNMKNYKWMLVVGPVLLFLGLGLFLFDSLKNFSLQEFLNVLWEGKFFFGGLILVTIGGFIFDKGLKKR